MQAFIMHVGHEGSIDIKYTVTKRQKINDVYQKLTTNAPEKAFFAPNGILSKIFPTGEFHCWGVPSRAEPAFERTQIGDLVLIIPTIGIHPEAGIKQLGVIKAKCPFRCNEASHILWPETPNDRFFPFIFFFDTEIGDRGWYQFLEDMGYKVNFHPRGYYKNIANKNFQHWGGVEGYLQFLRKNNFRKLN